MINGQDYDMLFLNIEQKILSGIELGKKIREEMDNQTIQLVYISEKEIYYKELFEVRAMNFLTKPLSEDKIIKNIISELICF